MKRDSWKATLRAAALVALVVCNYAMPVRADESCYDCTEIFGAKFCGILFSGEGHSFCEPHNDHCDLAGPCTALPCC